MVGSNAQGRDRARESAFVAALVKGDEAAYQELVKDHGPRMLAIATRYLPSSADAQDALQDAFVCVVRGIQGFTGGSSLDTWLHRIVVNCALMRLRTRRRRPESPLEPEALEGVRRSSRTGTVTLTAQDILSREELKSAVRESVSRLPENYRTVLLLRDVEGLELREVAELLGVGLSTVKIRLHRARHALRDALAPRFSKASA